MFDSFQEALEGALQWTKWHGLTIKSIKTYKIEPHEFYSTEFTTTTNKSYVCTWESSQVTFIEIPNETSRNLNAYSRNL